MKRFLMYLGVFSILFVPAQGAFAWQGIQSLNPLPYLSYLNPLPYIGIGENKTSFSLNPFKGFKNCDPCKVKVKECDTCTGAAAPVCPTCVKAFPKCDCGCQRANIPAQRIYIAEPKWPCMD